MEDFLIIFISFLLIMGIINIYKTKTSKVKYIESNLYDDNNDEYLVRFNEGTIPTDINNNCDAGANALSFMRENLIELVNRVKQEQCPNDKCTVPTDDEQKKRKGMQLIKESELQQLIERFNPDNISESAHDDKYTSYSVNKGEKVIFCIREKDGQHKNEIINVNTLMFVAIHELAHIMTTSIGHGEDFWNNMRYLLSVAIITPAKKNYRDNCNFKKKIQSDLTTSIPTYDSNNQMIYYYEDYSKPDKQTAYCGDDITTTPCNDNTCKI